jgi:hypothetical protein
MRLSVIAGALGALVAGLLLAAEPATAAKSKLGCERGKERWDAAAGKCVPGKAKAKMAKKAAAKAPAKK